MGVVLDLGPLVDEAGFTSAASLVETRLCKTRLCAGEAEATRGRWAGLCHTCKQDAIAAARAAGTLGGRKTGVVAGVDGELVATARELTRQARRVERAEQLLDRERHQLRKVYLRFGVEAGFLGGAR